MCGVFGAISNKGDVSKLIVQGIAALSYRGYDSSGVCLLTDHLYIKKTLGPAQNLPTNLPFAPLGIGHSRWATHGACTLENAHPHTSGNLAIVHNGIIQNYAEIKSQLIALGYTFSSQTDSEVIAHLFSELLKENKPITALKKMQALLKGRYAFLAVTQNHPDKIFALSNDLSLAIGVSSDGVCISSDLLGLQHCHSFKKINNNPFELSIALPLDNLIPMPLQEKNALSTPQKDITLHEIHQQPQLINNLITEELLSLIKNIPHCSQIMLIACGSSYHCALVFKNWLLSIGIYAIVEVASELKTSPLPPLQQALVIAISQSGETADTLVAMKKALSLRPQHSVAITNSPTSALAELCDTVLYINCGPEIGVASTKAVTAQMLVLYSLYLHLAKQPITIPKALSKAAQDTLALAEIQQHAEKITHFSHILCLGKNKMLPIAKELALKLKELTYIHSEAIPAGELKHGPLALIDSSVLCIVLDDGSCSQTLTSLSEIQARNGPVLYISPKSGLKVPCVDGDLNIITINIACQLLSYYTAKALGRSIDMPRNLAKSVTVE